MLNPGTPAEGIPIADYIAAKYGPAMAAQIGNPNNPLSKAGAAAGIAFTPSRRIVPTQNCHALLELFYTSSASSSSEVDSASLQLGDRFMELLMIRYFEKGEDVASLQPPKDGSGGGVPVLLQVAAEAGFPPALVQEFQEGSSAAVLSARSAVDAKDLHAKQKMRVNGVPFVVLENQGNPKKPLVFSGGQPVDAMVEYLQEAYKP